MEVTQIIGTILSIAFGGVTAALSGFLTMRVTQARMDARQDAHEKRLSEAEHILKGNHRPGLIDTVARHDYQISNLSEQVARIGHGGGGGV